MYPFGNKDNTRNGRMIIIYKISGFIKHLDNTYVKDYGNLTHICPKIGTKPRMLKIEQVIKE